MAGVDVRAGGIRETGNGKRGKNPGAWRAGIAGPGGKAALARAKKKKLGSPGVPGEKGNRRVDLNCGPEAGLAFTADPADRAHGVMAVEADGLTRYVPAAVRERRGTRERRRLECRPEWHPTKNLPAKPRRYHPSNLCGVRVDAAGRTGPVSLDSCADDLAERIKRIRDEMGVDLLKGHSLERGRIEDFGGSIRLRDLVEKARRGKPTAHELAVRKFLADAQRAQPHIKPETLERWGENPAPEIQPFDWMETAKVPPEGVEAGHRGFCGGKGLRAAHRCGGKSTVL